MAEKNDKRTYYTYKITAADSDKYYYGVSHVKIANATKQDCLEHNYYGSGGRNNPEKQQNKFVNWKRKHSNALTKEIVEIFKDKDEAYKSEKELIGDLWKTDLKCLNSRAGGINIGEINTEGKYSIKTCKIHGEVTHVGDTCATCTSNKSVKIKYCEIHGKVKHLNDECRTCKLESIIKIKNCDIHGKTKHLKNNCYKCNENPFVVTIDNCEKHGKAEHLGSKCRKCITDEVVTEKECTIHGLVKHQGNNCATCKANKEINLKHCPIHGLTKHNGKTCYTCIAEKGRHTKMHAESKNNNCQFC